MDMDLYGMRNGNGKNSSNGGDESDTKKLIFINSANRDKTIYPNPSTFVLNVIDTTPRVRSGQIKGVTLHTLTYLNSTYNIDATCDTIFISHGIVSGYGNPQYPLLMCVKIPHGNYTPTTLVSYLNTVGPIGATCDYSSTELANIQKWTPSFNSASWLPFFPYTSTTWTLDPSSNRLCIQASPVKNALTSSTSIHCPPTAITQQPRPDCTLPLDIQVSSINVLSTDVVMFTVSGCTHNVIFNALMDTIVFKSNSGSNKRLVINDVMFYEPDTNSGCSLNAYTPTTITISISGISALLASTFASSDMPTLTGMIRPYCTLGSAMNKLGFNQSIPNCSIVNVSTVSNGGTQAEQTSVFAMTADPVYVGTGVTVSNPSGSGTGLFQGVTSATLSASVAGYVMQFTLSGVANLTSPSTCCINNYFVADRSMFLDYGLQNVFMRLSVNGIAIGRITQSRQFVQNNDAADASGIFAAWPVDVPYGNVITKYFSQHDSGVYDIPLHAVSNSSSNRIYQLAVSIVDENGIEIQRNGLDWSCMLQFHC